MTKFSSASYWRTAREIEETLRLLRTDYLDICLLHGLRNGFEFKMRSPALKALLEAQKKGYARYIGLSSHGIGALEVAVEDPRMQVVLARINASGVAMDSYREGLVSKLIAIPHVQQCVTHLIPKRIMPSLSATIEPHKIGDTQQNLVKVILKKLNQRHKPVIGMKVLGAGELANQYAKCIEYVKRLDYVSAMVVGMVSKAEVEKNVNAFEECVLGSSGD